MAGRTRLDAEDLELLAVLHEANYSMRQMEEMSGVERRAIKRHLVSLGYDISDREHRPANLSEKKKWVDLYEEGYSLKEIGAHFRRHNKTISAYLKYRGVEVKDQGRPSGKRPFCPAGHDFAVWGRIRFRKDANGEYVFNGKACVVCAAGHRNTPIPTPEEVKTRNLKLAEKYGYDLGHEDLERLPLHEREV